MTFALIALCLTGISPDGNLNTPVMNNWSPVDAVINFTVLETWDITWADHALGLATWESGSTVNIIFSNSIGAELNSLDPATGASAGSVSKPAGSQSGFGVAFNNSLTTPIWHINSWQNSNLYYSEDNFSTWQTITNPCGTTGRGMSFDGTNYYQSQSDGVRIFTPGGSGQLFSALAPSQISGVAVVEYDTDATYFLITAYTTDIFVLYSYDGSSVTQVATGTTPAGLGATQRHGLTYCPSRGSIFFSYPVSGGSRISEMSFDVSSALTRETWGAIKSSF
jgi:hypothetical protein